MKNKKSKKKYHKEDLINTLNRLYRCRDLEISNLWQRSVFLSVFLILCFTAYGYLILNLVKENYDLNTLNKYNITCLLLSSISVIFSTIWILMAKASKAWYEVYESAISSFEYKYFEKINLPAENIMGEMIFRRELRNDNIFSRKGGAFSPSKINIAIGQISLLIWAIIMLLHSVCNLLLIHLTENKIKNSLCILNNTDF
ncbi:hypothetical protein J5295_05265 [Riemerella anatipestifer]|uniref:RipA family octameric membrane protein n=2 Tax=Riemerella anatipestifer TaxID=34085 RepID=UPI0001F0E137|nr:hypothetical protein [Riemerella anatipestifer]ADZ11624.1 hypothetical protein RIA_0455 [Riemerella anatipestifer RA-GD]AGC41162.1 hypothetical protein G148_1858 [Riemerella anatipestifer RA-CH-2]AKP72021.1 hypothetical protein CG09_1910 [Riemerella anatipestifer]AKQ40481.1 hypothetical protein AS87_09230 [Riemerella anatipestifer Yb2]EFT35414.1 hypothetical protein RAYM_04281 [Riemerella anatipestifer RA-YM]